MNHEARIVWAESHKEDMAKLVRLLKQLYPKPVPAEILYRWLMGIPPQDGWSGTRYIRKLVDACRWSGSDIVSSKQGYTLTRDRHQSWLYEAQERSRAIKILARLAAQKRLSLDTYLGQLKLRLEEID